MSAATEESLLIREDLVITGEAVALQMPPAPLPMRVLGILIDMVLTVIVGVVLLLALTRVMEGANEAQVMSVTITIIAVLVLVSPTVIETLTQGRSVGKMAMGLRVVRTDGGPVRLRHSLVRALTGVIEIWLLAGSAALICGMVDRRSRRLGDLLAGTYAILERTGPGPRLDLDIAPQLTGWARGAQVQRLPDALTSSARGFLERAARLAPHVRADHGLRLAEALTSHVAPAPPPGTDPEAFIAAVLALRRERELELGLAAADRSREEIAALRTLPHGVTDPA